MLTNKTGKKRMVVSALDHPRAVNDVSTHYIIYNI